MREPLWITMAQVRRFATAQGRERIDGDVRCTRSGDSVLHWHESGLWGARSIRNVIRWTSCENGARLDLAHLRLGPSRPIHLVSFDLTVPMEPVSGTVTYRSDYPHRCRDDLYSATLRLEQVGAIVISWDVVGPRTRQRIVTRYWARRPAPTS